MPALVVAFLALAFAAIQALIGGAKLVYGLPSYALFAVGGFLMLAARPNRDQAGPRLFCLVSTIAFALYVCVRAHFSPVEYQARYDFFMALGALIAYFVGAVHMPGAGRRNSLIAVLLTYAVVHVIVGVLQFTRGDNYMLLPWIYRPDYGWRASGFYICPNHLAGLLEVLGLIALSFCCWGRCRNSLRMLAGYAFAICLAGIAITGSRGGWLSTAFGLLAFAIISFWAVGRLRRHLFLPMLVAGIVGLAVLIGGALTVMKTSDAIRMRLGQVYDPTNMRILLWEAALKQFNLQPVVGTGAGTYIYYGRQFRAKEVQNDPIHAHNDYLELLAEYGLVGAGLCVVFLGAHIYSGVAGMRRVVRRKLEPAYRMQSNEFALLVGTLSGVAALIAHSTIDFNLHIPANTLLVAFLFGVLANPEADAVHQRPARPWQRYVAPATGAVLLAFAVPLIEGEYHGELSRIALRDRMYPEALAHAERALSHEKKNADLYYYRGEAQHFLAFITQDERERFKLHAAAADDFAHGLAVFPQDLRLLLKLGRTLDNLGRFKEAEPFYDRAFIADPNFGNVYAYYGLHLQLQGQLKRAEEFYRKAISLGETEVAPAGLADLKQAAAGPRRGVNDIFSDFITEPDEMEAEADAANPAAQPAPQ